MEVTLGKYKIIFHESPLRIFEEYTQHRKHMHEAGGVIIGKIIDGKINILKLSIPTNLDKSSRTNFERNKLGAQIIINYEFKNSNGQLVYLGEWHTHPEKYPTPSGTDLSMLKSQFSSNILVTDFLLLIIKGTAGYYMRIIDKAGFLEVKFSKYIVI